MYYEWMNEWTNKLVNKWEKLEKYHFHAFVAHFHHTPHLYNLTKSYVLMTVICFKAALIFG